MEKYFGSAHLLGSLKQFKQKISAAASKRPSLPGGPILSITSWQAKVLHVSGVEITIGKLFFEIHHFVITIIILVFADALNCQSFLSAKNASLKTIILSFLQSTYKSICSMTIFSYV
jgi:hypothetical protein